MRATYNDMKSIQQLFKETIELDHKEPAPDKYLKRMSRKCKYIDNKNMLPSLSYPEVNSKEFSKDIDDLKHHFHNPCLTDNFLFESDRSIEDVFKTYCSENGLNVDWKKIKDIVKDVDTIILTMKYDHNRSRPKPFLVSEDEIYNSIRDCKSPSFPSGHTAIAHFISDVLSKEFPQESSDLKTIASLIGQSRLENGVHFPSDVLYGRLVGEMLADIFINSEKYENIQKDSSKKDHKKFSSFLRRCAEKNYGEVPGCYHGLGLDIANFICRTNEIERININYSDAVKASKNLIAGYPIKNISKNIHINSTISAMSESHRLKMINSPYKMINIHGKFDQRVLEKGSPKLLRSYSHSSPTGTQYCNPEDIFKSLRKVCQIDNPFLKHSAYEWVHPFCDGNGRSGRVILLSDLGFDFNKVNLLIDNNYIQRLVSIIESHNIRELLL